MLLHVTRIVKTLTKLFTGQPSPLTANSKLKAHNGAERNDHRYLFPH
jgi:hypothetical protein